MQAIVPSPAELRAALDAAKERPRGLLIGGGFSDEEAAEGEAAFRAWDPSATLVVVRVTPGTVEKVGPAGVAGWIKGELDARFA